jgi:cholesterol transport system auxiliary component
VRLVRRQDAGAGSVRLRLDVDMFEAVYPAGTPQAGKAAETAAAPVVTVSFKATLMKRGGDFGAEKFFTASQPAGDNRVGAIVGAYSAATSQVLAQLTAWTDAQAPALSAQQDGPHPVMERPAPPLAVRSTSSSTTTTTSVQAPR